MTRQVAAVRLNWANIGDLLRADFSVLNAAHAVQSSGAVRLPWLTDAGGELCYYSFYCTMVCEFEEYRTSAAHFSPRAVVIAVTFASYAGIPLLDTM